MSAETIGPDAEVIPGEVRPDESTPEDGTLSAGESAQLQRIEDYLYSIDRGIDAIEALTQKLVDAANGHTVSLEFLTTNTAALFNGFAQMQASGGPAALLGMLKGGQGNA